jgi:pantetheine-phosphate adenylyltransferase
VSRTGLYAGSFDPITNGHLDIIERASRIVDRLIVLIAVNGEKKPMFTLNERRLLLIGQTGGMVNVNVDTHKGLTVEYARKHDVSVMFRGLRPVGDFEKEYQVQQLNQMLDPSIETVFLMCDPQFQVVSSGAVKDIARLKGNISSMVPNGVKSAIEAKLDEQ